MFFHNINPVFFRVGPLQVRYYGLVYFIGFLFIYFYFRHLLKRDKISNMNDDKLDLFLIYFMIGSILGARILDFVFFNTGMIFSDPLEILKIWHGGMSIHGGIIGAMTATFIFAKRHDVRFYELADYTVIPLMIFLGIGRIANFINGELWGTPSTGRFCIDYSHNHYIIPPAGCRHPYQIYESLKNFATGFILLAINAKMKLKEGLLFWYGMFMYNFFRFFIDYYRDGGEPRLFLGLTMTQYLCIIFTLISLAAIYLLSKKENNDRPPVSSKKDNKPMKRKSK